MNNSFRIMQKRFFDKQGPILDFEDLGNAVVGHINDCARAERVHGQSVDNRILGLSWRMDFTRIPYIGKSILQREYDRLGKGGCDTVGYSGKLWVRFERELSYGFDFLSGCMIHIGTGGYSTWEGPWQELGNSLQRHEIGVPWNLRQPLACYTFSCQFYLSDFPDLDQMALLQKLSDGEMPKEVSFFWQEDGLEKRDQDYINFLKDYTEKSLA